MTVMGDAALRMRWELLCAAAVTLFSFSGVLIMQMDREDRRTLFIFPIFLSVVLRRQPRGVRLGEFWRLVGPRADRHSNRAGVTGAPRRPRWLLTLLRYVTMIAAVICADLLLEASAVQDERGTVGLSGIDDQPL